MHQAASERQAALPGELLQAVEAKDYGRIIWYYRVVIMGWTSGELGELYGLATKGKPYTRRWVQLVESNSDKVPMDEERRRIMAVILNIPLAYLGIRITGEQPMRTDITDSSTKESIDLTEYRTVLFSYHDGDNNGLVGSVMKDIKQRISKLQYQSIYGKTEEQDQALLLLCGYHVIASSILSAPQRIKTAMWHVNNAITLAEERDYYPLLAQALQKRGSILFDQGNLTEAIYNFQKAKALESKIPPQLAGYVTLSLGHANAHAAEGQQDISKALALFDEAESYIGSENGIEKGVFGCSLDDERYNIDKGAALVAAPIRKIHKPQEALEYLSRASDFTNETPYSPSRKRQAYNSILQAKAYCDLGYYQIATTLAQDALVVMKQIHSRVNINRIAGLYQDLSTSSYGKSKDVTRLRIELLKEGADVLLK